MSKGSGKITPIRSFFCYRNKYNIAPKFFRSFHVVCYVIIHIFRYLQFTKEPLRYLMPEKNLHLTCLGVFFPTKYNWSVKTLYAVIILFPHRHIDSFPCKSFSCDCIQRSSL